MMKVKNLDFTRCFFLIASLTIIILSFFISDAKTSKAIFIGLLIITLLLLDLNMPKVAKLSEDNPKVRTMRSMNRLIIAIFIILGTYYLISPSVTIAAETSDKFLIIGLAIFIMIFGNISPKIPFNRYMGLRLPWTIRDEDTWRIAHRITGYLAFPIGILMIISSFFFESQYVAGAGIISWVLIPSLYSLWFYYKKYKM